MIAFVWFTCPKDYCFCAQSVASVREIEPSGRFFAIISDGDPDPQIEGVEVWHRTFDRGFHLNGEKATIGVASVLAEVAGTGASLVVKVDSDMRIAEPFWRDGGCVHKRQNETYMGLYAIPSLTAARLPELIQSRPRHHEGIAMSRAAIESSETTRVVEMGDFKPHYVSWIRGCIADFDTTP